MKQLGRLLSIVTWLLIAAGIIIISGGLLGRPLLVASVPTTSMVPTLRPNDLILVLPTWTITHPGLGDIVVFRTPQDRSWIVHRIVDGNAAEGFVTRGDANPVADPRRVFPRDMAGVVPQWNGGAMRLPRLGGLRLETGPLGSPIVAGVALVTGVFFLLMDVQPVKVPRLRHKRKDRPKGKSVLAIYLGLGATAFLTTLIPAWTLSSNQLTSYEIIAQRPANTIPFGKYLRGEVHREEIVVENPSPLPLLVVFTSEDPFITYTPWSALVPAGKSFTFDAKIQNWTLGHHEGSLRMGVFLPLLPPAFLASVAKVNMALAAILTALIPGVTVSLLGLFDPRARQALIQLRSKLLVRYLPNLL